MLRQLDIDWRREGGLKAVGLLGSDVYDKLELLRALRPVLPQTTFFTNHLDARFSHPDEWKETHNLIVVSENTLSLKGLGQEVAPFRDSGQTDLFQATLEAMGQDGVEAKKPECPFTFEIGLNGPVELDKQKPIHQTVSCLLPWTQTPLGLAFWTGGVIVLAGLLGTCLVPRVAFASHKKRGRAVQAFKWLGVPVCGILTVGIVWCVYVFQNSADRGEHFAWVDGTSAWLSIAIIVFAGFLSIYFIAKTQLDLNDSTKRLEDEFGFKVAESGKKPGMLRKVRISDVASPEFWRSVLHAGSMTFLFIPKAVACVEGKVDIKSLRRQYLYYGQFSRRMLRSVPMTFFYLVALLIIIYLVGGFPRAPIRGQFPFKILIGFVAFLFAFLTFFVIDAIALHAGFMTQLAEKETEWPPETFAKFRYPIKPDGPYDKSDLSDYWNILFIARRTEAIGNLIYYPFIVLSLLIVSRLSYFANWTWAPGLVVPLCIHFFLALFAAWRLPKVAREYREKVLERMERRKRQNLKDPQKTFDAVDAVIQDVRSTHQGAFAYLWEQPVIRALLLPFSGLGLATISQYLQH